MESPDGDRLDTEQIAVWRHRYRAARNAGMEHDDAAAFAENDVDIEQLRKLVAGGCPLGTLREIVL